MARFERFTFLCDQAERRAIADLAARLHRTHSDAVRLVVLEAARQLASANTSSDSAKADQPAERERGAYAAG